jgi:hypothetical protein
MCNAFVLSLVPTIICVCHSGTSIFSGDHGGFFLLVGYNLVVRARSVFLMYPCGLGLFRFVCILVGVIFLGFDYLFPFLCFVWYYFGH